MTQMTYSDKRSKQSEIATLTNPRFWSFVAKSGPDDCWLWKGARIKKSQYGTYWYNKQKQTAHRVAYQLYVQVTLNDRRLLVMHSCDNPPCCNPKHLSLGTHRDNARDCCQKERHRHGPLRNRFYGSENGRTKLSSEEIETIRLLHGSLDKDNRIWSYPRLGRRYGVHQSTIGAIVKMRTHLERLPKQEDVK